MSQSITISPSRSVADLVRDALEAHTRRLLGSLPSAREGNVEGLHQVRVAVRRIRSDLRTFRSLVDPDCSELLREELWWLGWRLGAVRDRDVLRDRCLKSAAPVRTSSSRCSSPLGTSTRNADRT